MTSGFKFASTNTLYGEQSQSEGACFPWKVWEMLRNPNNINIINWTEGNRG